MTLRSGLHPDGCPACGKPTISLRYGDAGGRIYDAEPTTEDIEQACFRLEQHDVQGIGAVATMRILDRPTAKRLREEGVALYVEHGLGCDRRQAVEPGPKLPWTTAA